jgi:NADPH-dependent ferric siderophore reductase
MPDHPVSDETRATAERLGVSAFGLEVTDVTGLSSGMVRIGLSDPQLATVTHRPGQDLTFSVPAGCGRTLRRRYTIRSLDAGAARVEVDVVLHGDGPGARWAAAAAAGDRVEAIGPRGKIFVDGAARFHLFAGDESYLPAAYAMVESLPEGDAAVVVLERGGDVAAMALDTAADLHGPLWVAGDGGAVAGAGLLAALAGVELPAGGVHAYAGGEMHAVNAVRDALVARGLDPSAVSAKPYWRAKTPNADHGEPVRG